eukprot:Hpha_TRINITY_DN16927_c1_g1::TRINITY_DN16927_c1_g1_i1::g.55717::m.55717
MKRREEEHNLWSLIMAVVPLGLLALVFGIWGWQFLDDQESDWKRGNQTARFNAAVARWNKTLRPAWEQVGQIELHDFYSGESASSGVILTPDSTEEPQFKLMSAGEDMSPYEPLRYVYRGKVPLSDGGDVIPWDDIQADVTFTTARQSRPRKVATGLALTNSDEHKTTNWKQCQHQHKGSLDQGRAICKVYKRLTKMCFKLQLKSGEGPPTWMPAGEEGAEGCDANSWKVSVAYRAVNVERFAKVNVGPRKASLDDVVFTVRADGDPFFVAQKLTHETFAMSHRERVGLGRVMLGGGILFGVIVIGLLWAWYTRSACYALDADTTTRRRRSPGLSTSTQTRPHSSRGFNRLQSTEPLEESSSGRSPHVVLDLRQSTSGYSSQ